MPYGQFWDIRVTYGGAYDFNAANVDQMRHQLLKNEAVQAASAGNPAHASLQVNQERAGDHDYETALIPVAAEIYRASYVPITDIEAKTVTDGYRAMVQWLASRDAAGPGKIRINAHGDGMGNFYMADNAGHEKYLQTSKIADWLIANGLPRDGKLRTVNLAICLAAQGPKGVAHGDGARLQPALNSGVSLLAGKFRSAGYRDIKITGSNEVVQDLGGQIHAAVLSKSLASLATFLARGPGGEYIVHIPQGWTVKPGSPVVLEPPKGATIVADPTNGEGKPAGGWVVQVPDEVDFTVPQGWQLLKGGLFSRTIIHVPFGLEGASNGAGQGGSLTLRMGRQGQVRDAEKSYFKAEEMS